MPSPSDPHVVLVLADDLGIGDAGCYNPASGISTPNLDRLAEEGLRLTDAHSPAAVCSPTRYALLTGRYAWRTPLREGVLWGDSPNTIETERVTLADALRSRGYRTAFIGKWHLGLGEGPRTDYGEPLRPGPLDHGFDRFVGIPGALDMPPYLYIDGDRPREAATGWIEESWPKRYGGPGFIRAGAIAPSFRHRRVLHELTDEAISVLEEARRDHPSRPLFLLYALTAPHTPWLAARPFRGQSGAGPYGDFVAQIDHEVGRLLAAIDRLSMRERTLFLFTSDNGAHWEPEEIGYFGHRANLDYRGQKGDIWEGGHRVPFLVRWPGQVTAGQVSDELLALTDLFRSLATIAGATVPAGAAEDSLDLSAVLLGRREPPLRRDELVLQSFEGVLALRRGPWKLVPQHGSGGFSQPTHRAAREGEPPGQLYDLAVDAAETTNRWADEPERAAELLARLRELTEPDGP